MNVRHPLSRLVSAWRDKFRVPVSSTSHKGDAGYIQPISYWMKKYGKFINAKFGREEFEIPEGYYVALESFLDYVAWVGRDARYDHHWKSFNYHCRPCQLKFQFITKAETSTQDADYILKKANIGDIPNVKLPDMYETSPLKSKNPEDYFVKVSHVTIERLHHAYRDDFRLFGYSSKSFENIATGIPPEVFETRKKRDTIDFRIHNNILRHLSRLNF